VKDLLRRTITGITLVILFSGSILLGPLPFAIMILVLYGLSITELFRLLSRGGHRPCGMLALSGALLIVFLFLGLFIHLNPLWMILPAILWIAGTLRMKSPGTSFLYIFWLAVPLGSFLALGWMPGGSVYHPLLPLCVIFLIWVNDIFAYLGGRFFGKHPMTPELSPGKTWEGFSGGMVFSVLGGWVLFRITGTFSCPVWIVTGGLVGLLGVAGDLFESGLKRKYGVKDTGTLLPGHGGILDRFDSLLLATPVILLVILFSNLAL
jgi:phosphatidate cytidylyltransferase